MNKPGDGLAVPQMARPEPPPSRPHAPAVVCSALALVGSFAALLQVDIPILWFLRSHNLSSLQAFGDAGERLGNGGTLVVLSILVLGTGLYLKRRSLTRLGWDSLLAHGVVALIVNGLKHVIGRPRPRLTHSGGWQWWPSLDSGLDSFPSGHTSASVAVVTVLARALPRLKWVPFAVAGWVGASRIWRGSHFPSDVVAGIVTGFVVGSIFNGPLRWWGRSCAEALVRHLRTYPGKQRTFGQGLESVRRWLANAVRNPPLRAKRPEEQAEIAASGAMPSRESAMDRKRRELDAALKA